MARSPSRSSSAGSPSLWIWLGIALVVVLLDQFSKQLIVGGFALGESRTVLSFFNVVRWHNTGAAFSFLAGSAGWQRWFFIVLALAASAFILWLLWRAVFVARDDTHRKLGLWLAGLLGFQFLLGGLDVLLRAPVWMQVLHLAGADAFWCVLVVLTASVTITTAAARTS